MADQQTNWILELVDKMTAPAKEVTAAVKSMETAVENVDKEVIKLGNDSEKAFAKSNKSLSLLAAQAGSQALVNLGQPLLDGAEGAYAYDASLKELSAITGVVGDNLDLIGSNARQSAKDLGGDAAESVKSYTLLLSKLAPEIADNPKALDAMGHSIGLLGETMHGDLVVATNAASSAMNQFGVDLSDPVAAAETMDLMLNQMVSSAKVGSQEVDQVAAALDQSGAKAKAANVSFAETNAALQVLGKYGKEGAEGGVALRNVLAILGKEEFLPKEVRKQLQDAGVDVTVLADKNRTLAERLTELKKLGGKDALLGAMFGQENTVAITGLLGNVDLLKQYTNDIVNDQTALADMAATMGTSYQESKDRIVSYFDDIKLSIYGATGSMLPFLDLGLQGIMGMISLAPGVMALVQMVTLLKDATILQTAAQWLLNIAMDANPIGLIILAITALIGVVAVVITYWEDWGAAVTLLFAYLTPGLSLVIGLVQSFRMHWDSITEAFSNGGIVAGIKRIGLVLLDAILYPVQQLLELLAHIPGLGGLAGGGAKFIHEMRANLALTEADPKKEKAKEGITKKATDHEFNKKQDAAAVVIPSSIGADKSTGGSNSGAGKIINMTLNVINNFNVKDGGFMKNKEQIVDYVVGRMNDSLKDALITAG
jgi:TP901 family phage tail tape measure protein